MRAQRRQNAQQKSFSGRQALVLVLCWVVAQGRLCVGQDYPDPDMVGAVIGVKPGVTVDSARLDSGTSLKRNALLRTDRSGRLRVRLRGAEVVTMGANSELRVTKNNPVLQQAVVNVISGEVRNDVGRFASANANYELVTPQASVVSRGNTDFYVAADGQRSRVIVYSGIAQVRSLNGPNAPVYVAAGQMVVVTPSAVSRMELTSEDLEQESLSNTGFPNESLVQNPRGPAKSHKTLYIVLGVAGAAAGGIAMAARGGGSSKSSSTTPTVPSSVPTIPAQ